MEERRIRPQERLVAGAGVQCELADGETFYAEIAEVSELESLTLLLRGPEGEGALQVGKPLTMLVTGLEHQWKLPARVMELTSGEPVRIRLGWPAEAQRVDRRADPRVDACLPIRVGLGDAAGASPIATYTLDVSAGGARIVFPETIPIGQPLDLELRLPRAALYLRGHVVWARRMHEESPGEHHLVGIAFSSPWAKRLEISRFVAKHRAASRGSIGR